MYLRTTRRRNRDGSVVAYYQLAETRWDRERHRPTATIIHNFGRADQLDREALRRLARSISRVADGGLDGYLPSVVVITEGKRHDVRVARTLRFDPGTIVVMDRGYTDYAWFGHLTAQGVWFVTRLKEAAVYAVVEDRRIPAQGRVERDQVIRLTGVGAGEKCPHELRRIEVYDPAKDETLVFLTNHLAFGATTIAAIYQDRWQIELFFKALKQNLRIKTFVGTSANALKVQVWTALIALLLLKYLQLRSRFAWSLSNLVALLRMNLFTHRDFWAWLDRPFEGPPAVLVTTQGELALG